MDPLSAASSIASVMIGCAKVVKVAHDIRGKYKGASVTIASIATECATVRTGLSQLQKVATKTNDFDEDTADTFETVILGCTLTMSVLNDYVAELTESMGEVNAEVGIAQPSRMAKMKLLWNESEMKELLHQLRGHQSSITMLLTTLQRFVGSYLQLVAKGYVSADILNCSSVNHKRNSERY